MLGLKHNINVLVDYDKRWPLAFEAERMSIIGALGCIAKGIEHYGSTAVVGMRAKPIIDILVGAEPLTGQSVESRWSALDTTTPPMPDSASSCRRASGCRRS
jgi:GrpB-like predicted nucleotidyltransferase (UPF0157 family)